MRKPGISPRLVLLLAVACGAAVANLYYAQPLLATIASSLGTSEATAGLLVTASQLGYAVGLVFLAPLGDLVDRRRLVTRMLGLAAVGLAVCAVAPSLAVLGIGLAAVGVTSVAAQVLVPFASDLASDDDRGRVVGVVVSGLLTGILVARTASGFIAEIAGWRAVFVIAAVAMVALAVLLHHTLPTVAPKVTTSYGALLRSIATLVRTEPVLRLRMTYGALGMAVFSLFWTSLTFLLSSAPYDYSDAVIGLFGLAGLVGAVAAQGAGRLYDRGLGNRATGVFWALVVVAWGLCLLGKTELAPLLVGIVLLDAGVQGQHILNQSTIFDLHPDARSRVNTAYMTNNFLFGAAGSAAGAAAWSSGGWTEVSILGGVLSVLALAAWVLAGLHERRAAAATATAPVRS